MDAGQCVRVFDGEPTIAIPPSIRAVVFDAVGTLIDPEPEAATVYLEIGRRFGSRLTHGAIGTRFRSAFARQEQIDHRNGLTTSEAREVERWRAIVAEVLDDVSDPPGCFAELYDHFSQPPSWRCNPEAIALLPLLQQRGLIIALASNLDQRLRRVVAGLPPLEPVTHLFISSEIGWRKPAPQFFTQLSQVLNTPADALLFVGDDLANDYEGARQAGLQAILYDPRGRHRVGGGACVANLRDLL